MTWRSIEKVGIPWGLGHVRYSHHVFSRNLSSSGFLVERRQIFAKMSPPNSLVQPGLSVSLTPEDFNLALIAIGT